jgi:hypothetical protein
MLDNKPHQQRLAGTTMQIVITSQWMICSKTWLTTMMGMAVSQ